MQTGKLFGKTTVGGPETLGQMGFRARIPGPQNWCLRGFLWAQGNMPPNPRAYGINLFQGTRKKGAEGVLGKPQLTFWMSSKNIRKI